MALVPTLQFDLYSQIKLPLNSRGAVILSLHDTQRGGVVIETLDVHSARAAEDRSRANLMGRWWRGHPASYALALLEPGLERYARLRPGRLVAYAAGAGVALVILRPWRLLSLGAIVALAFKATHIAGAVSAALDAPKQR